MLKAIIIDDEAKARRILDNLLGEYCEGIEVLDMAEDVLSAFKLIQRHKPDVIFLDIEMPNLNGFQLLECFDEINFEIIFTTAYSQYALKAFKASAIDYLLKPIDIEELISAVKRVELMPKNRPKKEQIETLKKNLYSGSQTKRIAFPSKNGMVFINVNEILYLKANGRNTTVFLANGKNYLTSRRLKDYEEMLNQPPFLRVHKSNIINLDRIKKYVKGRPGYLIMEDEAQIDLGKNRKATLIKAIETFM